MQESCNRAEGEAEAAARRRDELRFEIVELEDLAVSSGQLRGDLQVHVHAIQTISL